MSTTSEQMRAWTGPALFSYGFRPFFLGGALWAALAMCLWLAALTGALALPSGFDPASWHAHAFLFGYLGAVIAGFMMTAVPNWTGRMPIVGWALAGLFALWFVGRVALLFSQDLPPGLVAAVDLAFPVLFAAAMLREIIAGRNWRNLIIVGLLAVFILANAIFHLEGARGFYAAQGYGLRLGTAAALMMIAVIGGRIIPSFTRNWLAKQNAEKLPVPPMQRFDKVALLALMAALVLWVVWPTGAGTAFMLFCVAGLHLFRLSRWCGLATLSAPLVWVLHAAYAFVPLGALLEAISIVWPELLGSAPALHVWLAGAIGLMTLAVMTRATLGHSGRALVVGRGTLALYVMLIASVGLRFAAGLWDGAAPLLLSLSALCWIGTFGGFVLLYGPMILRARE
ncbi:NnrS family protein [Primorskyibacter sp. S187A]|uniref:NnrS family protein n=1 Tax=Primorskyibacter sp. S187A TaxID=3415130 RepID=UPI003C7B5D4D